MQDSNLPFGEVRAILYSQDGFMWIGGDTGMYRYDGYEFAAITIAENAKNETSELRHISALFEDSQQRIWVGSTAGLLVMDRDSNHLNLVKSEISVNAFAELSNGDILVATYQGLLRLNPAEQSVTSLFDEGSAQGLKGQIIFDILVDNDRDVWLATRTELLHFDATTQAVSPVRFEDIEGMHTHDLAIRALARAPSGRLWLGSLEGLISYDTQSQSVQYYSNDPNDPTSLSSNQIWDLHVDRHGDLWVATDGGGLNQLPAGAKSFIRHQYEPNHTGKISSNVVRCITEDKFGDLWIGNFPSGLNYLDRSLVGFSHYTLSGKPGDPISNSIMSIVEDADQHLWLGTDGGGIISVDNQARKISHFRRSATDTGSLSSNAILDLHLDGETLWIGTWGGGVNTLDTSTGQVERLPFTRKSFSGTSQGDTLQSANIWKIAPDTEGNIWFGTHDAGLAIFNTQPQAGDLPYQHFTYDRNTSFNVPSDTVWDILHTENGDAYLATVGGVCLFEGQSKLCRRPIGTEGFNKGLSSHSIISISLNWPWLWLGTGNGLHRYHLTEHHIQTLTEEDGLADSSIRALAYDHNGKLWIGTRSGVSVYDPELDTITNFEDYQGHPIGPINPRAVMKSRSGHLWFGGVKGAFVIDPDAKNSVQRPPEVALTKLSIFAKVFTPTPNSPTMNKVINRAQTITLDHTQRMFTLSFAALSFRTNTYAYMLEGFDDEWHMVGHLRDATYTNLDPGVYRFRVKAANEHGIWSAKPAEIEIVVLPAPWQTWWAKLLYGITILAIGVIIFLLGRYKLSADRFRELSITDPLTKSLNRAGIKEIANVYFTNNTLIKNTGIMILDLDHFKKINDTYGHDTGDDVLIQFAELIKRSIRKGDHLGRWGGEEFILICPSIDTDNLKRLAEKLVSTVATHKMRSQGQTLTVTTSIGFCMANADEHFDACVAAADKALYLAKAKRNMAVGAGHR